MEKGDEFRSSLDEFVPQTMGEAWAIGVATTVPGGKKFPRYVVLTCGFLFIVVQYANGKLKRSPTLALPKDKTEVARWFVYLLSECYDRIDVNGSIRMHFYVESSRKRSGRSDDSSGAGGAGDGGGVGTGGAGGKSGKAPVSKDFKSPTKPVKRSKTRKGGANDASCGADNGDDHPLLTVALLDACALRPLNLHENVYRLISE